MLPRCPVSPAAAGMADQGARRGAPNCPSLELGADTLTYEPAEGPARRRPVRPGLCAHHLQLWEKAENMGRRTDTRASGKVNFAFDLPGWACGAPARHERRLQPDRCSGRTSSPSFANQLDPHGSRSCCYPARRGRRPIAGTRLFLQLAGRDRHERDRHLRQQAALGLRQPRIHLPAYYQINLVCPRHEFMRRRRANGLSTTTKAGSRCASTWSM